MIYSLFYRHNSSCTVFWVNSFYLSVNNVVLYQFTVPGHAYRKLRILSWSVKSLGRKKGSRLRLCFRVVDDVPEKKGMDLWKQMSSSKCSFTCICGIFLPLNPSTTTVYARSAFYPSLRFTLSLQSAFYTQSAFYPWSAVCVLHWPIVYSVFVCMQLRERILQNSEMADVKAIFNSAVETSLLELERLGMSRVLRNEKVKAISTLASEQDLLVVLNRYPTFTSCQNAACFNTFFSLAGRLCSWGLYVLTKQMWF